MVKVFRLLVIRTLLLLFPFSDTIAQEPDLEKWPSFKSDTTDINIIFDSLDQPPPANFYLMAELHQVKANPYLQVEFIKYLNKKRNLQFIVLEMSHANAFLYNLYLENGDTAFLRWSAYDGRHSSLYFSKLYDYNKTLPPGKKLKFIGVDLIMSNSTTFRKAISQFQKLSAANPAAGEINLLFEAILLESSKTALERSRQKLKEIIFSDTALYSKLFANKFDDLKIILSNSGTDNGRRDDEMFENFKRIIEIKKLSPDNCFFGSFGNSHVQLLNDKDTFRSFLEGFSFFKNNKKISIIGIQYYNCYALHDRVLIKNDGIFSSYSKSKIRENKEYLELVNEFATGFNKLIAVIQVFRIPGRDQSNLLSKIDFLVICKDFPQLH
jgi:hypothetical protein